MTVYANIPFNPATWLDLPAVWDDVTPDAATWGQHSSRSCWIDSGLPHGPEHLDYLAQVLTSLVTSFGPGVLQPEHEFDPTMEIQTLLYLPDPRVLPFPLRVMVFHEELVKTEKIQLLELVQAEDPEAINEPEVLEFEHPHLGTGVRAFRHRTSESTNGSSEGTFAVLKYAFPIPGHDDLLFVTLSWPDLARVAQAEEDIDELVRSITFEYHPDLPLETSTDA